MQHISRKALLESSYGIALTAGFALASATPGNAQETPVIKVGSGLIEPQAEAYYAEDLGYFKQRRLNVQIQKMRSGSAIAAAVLGGELDIGVSNTLSLAQAHQRGIPIVVIAPGSIHDYRVPTELAVVAPNSSIRTGKDLNGQTVAGSTIGSMDQLAMMALIDKTGGDISLVKFVEVPQSAIVVALTEGRIQGAFLSNPELDAAGSRVRVFGNAQDAIAKVFMQTAWFTTRDWLAKNKDTARRFADAVTAAGKWAMANPQPAALVMDKYLGFKEPLARQRFGTNLDSGLIQVMLDSATKYKLIPPVNAAEFIWTGK